MKKILAILFSILSRMAAISQNAITPDGNYIAVSADGVLIVKSTNNEWKKEINKATNALFTSDSKLIIYKTGDSMCLLTLGSDRIAYINDVASYKLPTNDKGEWLVYQIKNKPGALVLHNLSTGEEKRYTNVTEYSFDDKGKVLLLKKKLGQDNTITSAMDWINLIDGSSTIIWSDVSGAIINYAFDVNGTQLTFIVQETKVGKVANTIWYYSSAEDKAKLLINDDSTDKKEGLLVGDKPVKFSKNGDKIFFWLKEKDLPKPDPAASKVDVWSYTDAVLQSQQSYHKDPINYAAVISLEDHKIVRLEQQREYLLRYTKDPGNVLDFQENDNYALICQFEGDIIAFDGMTDVYAMNDYNWNKATQSSIYLVSVKDGSRKLLKDKSKATSSSYPYFRFSPEGRFVIYYDQEQKTWISYEVASGIKHNLTKDIAVSWAEEFPESGEQMLRTYFRPYDVINWLENDSSFFVYDRYRDIWQLDPAGQKKPVNVTNGYARKNHLIFIWISTDLGKCIFYSIDPFNWNDQKLFRKILNTTGDPEQLTKGIYKYRVNKALNREIYLVQRESESEYPFCFYTRDFKSLIPVINAQPKKIEKKYFTELITWKSLNGKKLEGMLCKPLDFDPQKKYPLMINYYSNDVSMRNPQGFAMLKIEEWLKSGYLFFNLNMDYSILGETGQTVDNSIVAAAQYLSKLPFIDAKKMGIQGHSFGGFETNYIITHTNLFAAAYSSCGPSDLVSLYGRIEDSKGGYTSSSAIETGQFNRASTLWDRPDLYIKNSPIFYADKVITPILMMSNKKDPAVPWTQGVEFFKALRRLNKRAWLLQYDEGDHGVGNAADIADVKERVKQFFDHYLKGAPAPVWMTKGIPAKMKGLKFGFEYDSTMKTPGRGLLMDNEEAITQQQKELLKHKTTVNKEGRIVDVKRESAASKKVFY